MYRTGPDPSGDDDDEFLPDEEEALGAEDGEEGVMWPWQHVGGGANESSE
jgi:hypothetical protein